MSLLDLLRLPDLVVMSTIVIVVAGLAAAAPQLGRMLLRLPHDREREASAFDAYRLVFSMFGVMLSFLLFEASAAHRGVEDAVVKEAAALSRADRTLLRMGSPDFAAIRTDLAGYGALLVNDEWQLQFSKGRSAAASEAFAGISDKARKLGPHDGTQ